METFTENAKHHQTPILYNISFTYYFFAHSTSMNNSSAIDDVGPPPFYTIYGQHDVNGINHLIAENIPATEERKDFLIRK